MSARETKEIVDNSQLVYIGVNRNLICLQSLHQVKSLRILL